MKKELNQPKENLSESKKERIKEKSEQTTKSPSEILKDIKKDD